MTFLAALALMVAPTAPAPASYCSPTGDWCTAVKRIQGAVFLDLGTFSFSGRYRLCVADPGGRRSCRSFGLTRRGDLWRSRVRWHTNFPSRGAGVYKVTWHYTGVRLGPTLTFRVR